MALTATITPTGPMITGELAKGTRRVHVQHRATPDGPWEPRLGTRAAVPAGLARTLLAAGPWAFPQYRLTEATETEEKK